MYPRSGFRSGGTCERTLVPVFSWSSSGGAPEGATSLLHFSSAPDPLFKASKAPFLTLRVATPSGAPRQVPLDFRSGATSECTLVPVFVPGEHPPKPPFWKPTYLSTPECRSPGLRNCPI